MLHLPVLLALLAAWIPPEVFPWTAPLLAVLGLAVVQQSSGRPTLPQEWRWAAGCLALVTALSTVLGLDHGAALSFLGLILLTVAGIWSGRAWGSKRAQETISWGLAGLSLWALLQVTWTFGAAETVAAGLPSGLRDPVLYRLATRRAVAGLVLPGHLAIVLVMALALTLDRRPGGGGRPLWWGQVALLLAGIVATRSLMGMGLAVLVVLVMAPPRVRRWMFPAVLAVGFAVALSRKELASAIPLLQRFDNWRTALWIWIQHPWLGAGPGAYRQAAQAVPFPVSSVSAYAHNLPLQALAELGPVGLGAVVWGYARVFRQVVHHWTGRKGLAVAVAAVALHNLVDFSLLVAGVLTPWAVLLGMLSQEDGDEVPPHPLQPRLRGALIVTGVVAVVLTGLGAASRSVMGPLGSRISLEQATSAVALAPWRIPPRLALASAALQGRTDSQTLERAARAVRHGLDIAPRSAALELAAARLALATGDPTEALVHVWRSLRDRPGWPPAKEFQQRLLHLLGDLP